MSNLNKTSLIGMEERDAGASLSKPQTLGEYIEQELANATVRSHIVFNRVIAPIADIICPIYSLR